MGNTILQNKGGIIKIKGLEPIPTPTTGLKLSVDISSPTTFNIPHSSGFNHYYYVWWGDGTMSYVNSYDSPHAYHDYDTGQYEITISGTCETLGGSFTNSIKNNLKEVVSWGPGGGLKYVRLNDCTNLTTLPNESGRLSGLTSYSSIFDSCTSLTAVPDGLFQGIQHDSGSAIGKIFNGCTSLVTVGDNLFSGSTIESINSLFKGCTSLTGTAVKSNLFKDSKIIYSDNVFNGCTSITDLPNVDLFADADYLTSISYMFNNCVNLEWTYESNWDVSNITNMDFLFNNCSKIGDEAVPTWYNGSNPQITSHTYTFTNNTARYDYSSIPNDWKGL